MNKTFKYQLYKIEWEDICSDSAWATDTEFDKMQISKCVSIGYIYKNNKKYVCWYIFKWQLKLLKLNGKNIKTTNKRFVCRWRYDNMAAGFSLKIVSRNFGSLRSFDDLVSCN